MKSPRNSYSYISFFVIVFVLILKAINTDTNSIQLQFDNEQKPQILDVIMEQAMVIDIVDGDTIWVNIAGVKYKVRFIGVDTPERDEFGYEAATKFTKDTLLNQWIYLEKDVSEVDRYDRLLRYVWLELPQNNTDEEKQSYLFNGMIISQGFGEVAIFEPDVKYQDYLNKINGN